MCSVLPPSDKGAHVQEEPKTITVNIFYGMLLNRIRVVLFIHCTVS